jgi:hypothetical protein
MKRRPALSDWEQSSHSLHEAAQLRRDLARLRARLNQA